MASEMDTISASFDRKGIVSETKGEVNEDNYEEEPIPAIWDLENPRIEHARIEDILDYDKKDEFVQLIKSQLDAGVIDSDKKRERLVGLVQNHALEKKCICLCICIPERRN
ncbi:hypothetical protein ACH5RR_038089 [Cinchona calisaya]|uniref:Uncharacterized protein n=1 Tax=Cinchona calisaya TaxID=153742 RepID=A0ABD2YBQ0_9GENT